MVRSWKIVLSVRYCKKSSYPLDIVTTPDILYIYFLILLYVFFLLQNQTILWIFDVFLIHLLIHIFVMRILCIFAPWNFSKCRKIRGLTIQRSETPKRCAGKIEIRRSFVKLRIRDICPLWSHAKLSAHLPTLTRPSIPAWYCLRVVCRRWLTRDPLFLACVIEDRRPWKALKSVSH